MYNHNKAQQSKNRVHISWDILYEPSKDSPYPGVTEELCCAFVENFEANVC